MGSPGGTLEAKQSVEHLVARPKATGRVPTIGWIEDVFAGRPTGTTCAA